MAIMKSLAQWNAAAKERETPDWLRSSEGRVVTVVGSLLSVAQRIAPVEYQPRSPSQSRSGFTLMLLWRKPVVAENVDVL